MNFDRICRFCLQEKPNLMPLFADESLPFRIMILSPGLKISPDDNMPSQICSKCVWLANSSFRFHMQCRVSQIALDSHKEGVHTDHASKVQQISMVNDVRSIREISVTSNQQNVANNSQATQTEKETKINVSTMTDIDCVWPYAIDLSRQWCAYIRCNYITKDNVFIKALNDVITKNSNVHFPEIQGRRIYQMDMTVRVFLNNSYRHRNSAITPPIIDLTTDDEEENTVVLPRNSNNHVGVQTESTNIKIAVSRKKSCLKRTENLDVTTANTKKVRFSEPTEEIENEIINNLKEKLAHCTTCKKVFESSMNFVPFVEHLKEHGQQDITCMKCNKTIKNPKNMLTHLKKCRQADNTKLAESKSESEVKKYEYTCSNGHKEIGKKGHSNQVCEFCDRSFPEAYHLLEHIRLHFPYNSDDDSSD